MQNHLLRDAFSHPQCSRRARGLSLESPMPNHRRRLSTRNAKALKQVHARPINANGEPTAPDVLDNELLALKTPALLIVDPGKPRKRRAPSGSRAWLIPLSGSHFGSCHIPARVDPGAIGFASAMNVSMLWQIQKPSASSLKSL